MAISQAERMIRIKTPLADDPFVVLSFEGTEAISKLYTYHLQLASEKNNIAFEQLAGKSVTVGIKSADGSERYFNGIIIGFSPAQISKKDGYSRYNALMAPAIWSLTECYDCRIFQDKTVKEIINEVLDPGTLKKKGINNSIHFRFEIDPPLLKRGYCVQYNESDFNFIARLCEDEGICYYFIQKNGKHTIVFANTPDKHKPYTEGKKEKVKYQDTMGGDLKDEVIINLQQDHKLMTGKYVTTDYNFLKPDKKSTMSVTQNTQKPKSNGEGELYEYPGGYQDPDQEGKRLAKIRMEASDVNIATARGASNCRLFIPGYRFKLAKYFLDEMNNKDHLITMVHHQASQEFQTGESGQNGDKYVNYFQCSPHSVPFRPLRRTPKPQIVSSQTAIVTGPKGEEIHTDKHGRVKVRFHWDRREDTDGDGNMSCWIRVSQNWAGAKWGAMHIPRVDQEVIVNFLDGDPDRPLITGRVYHGHNLPPYDLPTEKTKSTIMSNSSKNSDNFNEIRFEDLKDQEEFFTHAAKDRKEVVENDKRTEVKAKQTIEIEKDRALTVNSGNETITIAGGSREVDVAKGETHKNGAGFEHNVTGNYTLKVKGNITIDASGIVKISGAKVILNG